MNKSRKSNKNSSNDLSFLAILFVTSGIILATVAILFGGIFEHLSLSPPEISKPDVEQTTNYEPPTTEKDHTLPSTSESTDIESSSETTIIDNSEQTTKETISKETQSDKTVESSENETTDDIVPAPEQDSEPKSPKGTVYLTFDDGPSTKITSQILDILKEKNVKATFFVLDYSYGSEKEEIIIREFEEGHTVGLHGISHDYATIYSSLDILIKNFTDLQEKIKTSTGYTSTIIRFPGGSSNTVSKKYATGIMSDAVEYFSNSEFVYFDWNLDSRDAGGVSSSEEIYTNVTTGLKPGRNNVVLMHDSSNKQYTLDALERIIDFCIAEGYEFKSITQKTPQVTHVVSN